MGFLSGRERRHQGCVAPDFQVAVLKNGIVAQVGVQADIPARRRVLVPHRLSRGVSHQLVQAGDGNQFIPIHPANTPDPLVTRPADTPAQEVVVLSPA